MGENVLPMHDHEGGLGKCKVRTPHWHKGLGADKGN
jgi:hypothetical protein